MTTPPLRIGELFAGYGGLGMAVQAAIPNTELAWVSEFDKGPSKVLEHRFPGVPNHGDITAIDWATVEPVDIITGGSPCQDLSHAGKRQGMTDGTRSNLWVSMREAIATIRPRLVVWENVRGAFSAQADSAMEPCPGCVGDGRTNVLRALGRVLGDLSELGYDTVWCGLRAADVGAPHNRFRVFVLAWDAAAYPDDAGREELGGGVSVRPEHPATEHGGPDAVTLLPTPAVNDMGAAYTPETWDAWTDKMKAKHGNGNGHGKSLNIEAQRLLPTPTAADASASGGSNASNVTLTDATVRTEMGTKGNARLLPTPSVADATGGHATRSGDRSGELLLPGVARAHAEERLLPTPMVGSTNPAAHGQITGDYRAKMAEALDRWGDYGPAIARWEHVNGPAPEPTTISTKGNPQLSAAFTEWLMGLPAGWITDVPGVTRNEALKMCGNGVVPQQGAAALRWMLAQVSR